MRLEVAAEFITAFIHDSIILSVLRLSAGVLYDLHVKIMYLSFQPTASGGCKGRIWGTQIR
jgi:hypothetical protein